MTVSVDFILFMRLLPLEMPVEMETVWTAPTAQLIRASCAHVRLCGSSSTAKHKRPLCGGDLHHYVEIRTRLIDFCLIKTLVLGCTSLRGGGFLFVFQMPSRPQQAHLCAPQRWSLWSDLEPAVHTKPNFSTKFRNSLEM